MSLWPSLAVLVLGGCELFANIPDYTATNLDGNTQAMDADDGDGSVDAPIDAPAECVMSTQCTAPEICVQGDCQLCDSDAHCGPAAENVCLPDGRCAAASRIAYAATNGSGGACSVAAPCTIEQAFATAAGSPTIDIVKLGAGTYSRAASITTTDTVILAGEGATMMAADSIQMLRVESGGSLTLVGLTLVGNQQYNGLCFGASGTPSTLAYFRVTSTMGAYGIGGFTCNLDVTRSTITQSSQIGAYVSGGSARFVNSVIRGSTNGALFLNGEVVARVEHSTIAGNTSASTTSSGITCGNASETIVSSIIWGNTGGDNVIDPACVIDYSVVDPTYAGGTQNVRVDPLFLAAGDFHIQTTSPARGAASPASAIMVDHDNQPRPQTAGAADCGADEVP
jgi:hypothetical protein